MWQGTKEVASEPRPVPCCFSFYHLTDGHDPPPISYASWPLGELGTSIAHGRRVGMCIADGKKRRSASRQFDVSIVAVVLFWWSEPGSVVCTPNAVGTAADVLRS